MIGRVKGNGKITPEPEPECPEKDPTSIGNLAMERGFITREDLREAITVQQKRQPLGEILVEMKKLTRDQLDDLIFEQQVLRGEITDRNKIREFERARMHRKLGLVKEGFHEVRKEIQQFSLAVMSTTVRSKE